MGLPKGVKAAKVASAKINHFKMDSPSYASYLLKVWNHNGSEDVRRALLLRGKAAFDAEYTSQLRKQYDHEESIVRNHLQEINSKANIAHWERLASKMKHRDVKKGQTFVAPEVDRMRLPAVGQHSENSRKGGTNQWWDLQTYEDFAVKLDKLNGDVVLNKQLTDDAFRKAVSKLSGRTKGSKQAIDKAMARCLGKESSNFWEDRQD